MKWIYVSLVLLILTIVSLFVVWWFYLLGFQTILHQNVFLEGINLSKQTPNITLSNIEKTYQHFVSKGVQVKWNGKTEYLKLLKTNENEVEPIFLFSYDQESLQNSLKQQLLQKTNVSSIQSFLKLKKQKTNIHLTTQIKPEMVKNEIRSLFPDLFLEPKNASFVMKKDGENISLEIVEGISGKTLDEEIFRKNLIESLVKNSNKPIVLQSKIIGEDISKEKAQLSIQKLENLLPVLPIELQFNHQNDSKKFSLTKDILLGFLEPSVSSNLTFDENLFHQWFVEIEKQVKKEPINARFQIENDRVIEFAQNKNGYTIDETQFKSDLIFLVNNPIKQPIQFAIQELEPTIMSHEGINLGIKELLGYGTSSYKGSPINRRKNIQNGVDKLNGLLIAPDEEFSLVKQLEPFTTENGYLSELVIKGNEITPEVGGGLCQIGTTTFRAVMYSGMPVVERKNHSIVVNYYNDPQNGNPGTDATIYGPKPDFKFKNDTGNYVLLIAENNTKKQELKFSFYGTKDGRKGFYTPPKVLKWFPVSEPVITENETFKEGEEKCQEAHVGASTIFTYVVEKNDGTVLKQDFSSYYRPLPKMCVRGKQKTTDLPVAQSTQEPSTP